MGEEKSFDEEGRKARKARIISDSFRVDWSVVLVRCTTSKSMISRIKAIPAPVASNTTTLATVPLAHFLARE